MTAPKPAPAHWPTERSDDPVTDARRLVRVVRVLWLISREPRRWARKDLAAHFGVATHTIQRDVRLLERALGVTIRRARGQQGGYFLDEPLILTPAEADLQWLAAIVDGAGHIRVAHPGGKVRRGRGPYYASVELSSADRGLVERARRIAGAGSLSTGAGTGVAGDLWTWSVTYRAAARLLGELRPHLVLQAAAADAALAVQALRDRPDRPAPTAAVPHASHRRLADGDVREIRRLRGRVAQDILAARFGVSVAMISRVQRGTDYKHVTDEERPS